MLNNKQKNLLKGRSNILKPMYQIGKKELSNAALQMLDKALIAHELIKIQVLKAVEAPLMEIALDLASNLHADVIQVIGRVIVLYRPNPIKPKIELD
ncbi:MAG: YhbY family RNA-binding protein [Firmicutes bacterium]|nr:YhbY family RNA-binding protein [Bacillota bacterium]